MAIGKASDFVINDEVFWGAATEVVAQNSMIFNEASRGAIVLVPELKKGDYEKESFIQQISSLVTRRDTTSTSAATALAATMAEIISVKLNRKIGPVEQTLDALRKVQMSSDEFSFLVGQQYGKGMVTNMANAGIKAVSAALSNVANVFYDYSATGTITHGAMNTGLAKFGDRAGDVVAWLFHSKAYFDLMGQAITDKITDVAGPTINQGTVATFGKPAIVSDDASLLISGAPDDYLTLGLVAGAVRVQESEDREIVSEVVTGGENLTFRIQGEFAYNVGCKGFQWDTTNGGANPNDTALGTGTNWDQIATEDKDLAGVCIRTQ